MITPAVSIGLVSFILICALGLFSPTPLPIIASGASLGVILILLWRPNDPPVLLFPVFFQWTTVAVKPLLSAFRDVPLNELAAFGTNLEPAVYFGLAAITALAFGIRLGAGSMPTDWTSLLAREAKSLPFGQVFRLSIVLLLAGQALFLMTAVFGPLRQLLLAMSGVGFVGLFAIAYWVLKNRRGYAYLAAVMIVEIVIGITGFFSEFRTPVLMLCVAAICARSRMRATDMAVVAAAGLLLLSLGAFWSEVKIGYRQFGGGGLTTQVMVVPLEKRIDYMVNELVTFDGERYSKGLELLMARHSYIDFLSGVLNHVPTVLPHENGKRLGAAAIHIITPRILFPNKPLTESDSIVTAKYTGIPIMVYEGTSISIGYLGELYIDFGISGSIFACFLGGFGFGALVRHLRDRGRGPLLLRFGLCAIVALTLATFETALIKLFGGIVTVWISAFLLQRFVLPYLVKFVRLRPTRPLPPGPRRRPMRPADGVGG